MHGVYSKNLKGEGRRGRNASALAEETSDQESLFVKESLLTS
jgi:hypothetical protein